MKQSRYATHAETAHFLQKWHERDSWGDIARSLLGIQRNTPYRDDGQRREIKRVASLLSAQARGATRSDEVVRLLGYEPRKTDRIRICYECGRGKEARKLRDEVIRAEMEAANCDSFTDYVDWMRGKVQDV